MKKREKLMTQMQQMRNPKKPKVTLSQVPDLGEEVELLKLLNVSTIPLTPIERLQNDRMLIQKFWQQKILVELAESQKQIREELRSLSVLATQQLQEGHLEAWMETNAKIRSIKKQIDRNEYEKF